MDFLQLTRASVDGTGKYRLNAVKRGIKTLANHNRKHPITERSLLCMWKIRNGDDSICGTHVMRNDISDVQKPISMNGVEKGTLKVMNKMLSQSNNVIDKPLGDNTWTLF